MELKWYLLVAFVVLGLVGGMIELVRTLGGSGMKIQQFGVALGIAVLLPLAVHYGAELIRPTPKEDLLYARVQKLDQQRKASKQPEEKRRLEAERAAVKKRHYEGVKRHQQVLFALAYLVGLTAIILGALLRTPTLGGGLLFGGLFALTDGCFSYWETMASWLRFFSLLGALFVLVVLGFWKFGGSVSEPERPAAA